MNFNDINGVWPQIKDYIDSKLGGGTSKYKHMIYIQNLWIGDSVPSVDSVTTNAGSSTINDITLNYNSDGSIAGYFTQQTVWKVNNRLIFYVAYYSIGSTVPIFLEKVSVGSSNFGLALKEGWYINCMGQIYDWKGNIVE